MPRGDLMYFNQPGNDGSMRRKKGMPPSHNCVWTEPDISSEDFAKNWYTVFGDKKEDKKVKCTCSFHEETDAQGTWIVKEKCSLHAGSYRKALKLTKKIQGFSKSHLKKVKDYVYYGNINPRELTDRH